MSGASPMRAGQLARLGRDLLSSNLLTTSWLVARHQTQNGARSPQRGHSKCARASRTKAAWGRDAVSCTPVDRGGLGAVCNSTRVRTNTGPEEENASHEPVRSLAYGASACTRVSAPVAALKVEDLVRNRRRVQSERRVKERGVRGRGRGEERGRGEQTERLKRGEFLVCASHSHAWLREALPRLSGPSFTRRIHFVPGTPITILAQFLRTCCRARPLSGLRLARLMARRRRSPKSLMTILASELSDRLQFNCPR